MKREDIVVEVRSFVVRELCDGDDEAIEDTTHLLEEGVLDSIAIMNLIAFVEDRFEIEVLSEYLTPQNLSSLNAISELVLRLRDD